MFGRKSSYLTEDEIENILSDNCKKGDYGICPRPLSDHEALGIIAKHLIGEPPYYFGSCNGEQMNSIIVSYILREYPKHEK